MPHNGTNRTATLVSLRCWNASCQILPVYRTCHTRSVLLVIRVDSLLTRQNPLSLADFRGPNAKDFDSLHAFDHMMVRFFEKARRYFPVGSAEYGKVLVLQRLYNALTAAKPLSLPEGGGPLPPAATNFAAIPAGPGQQKTLQDAQQEARVGQMPDEGSVNGLTTYRVSTKDREFTTEARHKGQVFRIGKLWPRRTQQCDLRIG